MLSSLLHDYSRFNVSTIDHFFTHLIRHLAKELDLNLGYELDIDSQKALSGPEQIIYNGNLKGSHKLRGLFVYNRCAWPGRISLKHG